MFSIKSTHDAGIATMKCNPENKTTTDFLVGNENETNSHEINSIECKTSCVSGIEEMEINQWGDGKHVKKNCEG